MKRIYITPKTKAHNLQAFHLLAGSDSTGGGNTNTGGGNNGTDDKKENPLGPLDDNEFGEMG